MIPKVGGSTRLPASGMAEQKCGAVMIVLLLLSAVLICADAPASASSSLGLRIVARSTFPAGVRETTTFVGSDRVREESRMSSHVADGKVERQEYVHIRRCDLNRIFVLNPAERTYLAAPLESQLSAVERLALSMGRSAREVPDAPAVLIETTTVDTGERKISFGYSARRVVTTRREIPSQTWNVTTETVTDGWYIDLDTRPACERDPGAGRLRGALIAVAASEDGRSHRPRVTFKNIGKPEEGFAIETMETSRWWGDGATNRPPALMMQTVVTEISRQPLEPGLFEVPAGFRSTNGMFSRISTRLGQTVNVLHAVVASWFR